MMTDEQYASLLWFLHSEHVFSQLGGRGTIALHIEMHQSQLPQAMHTFGWLANEFNKMNKAAVFFAAIWPHARSHNMYCAFRFNPVMEQQVRASLASIQKANAALTWRTDKVSRPTQYQQSCVTELAWSGRIDKFVTCLHPENMTYAPGMSGNVLRALSEM
jgi:hypothetical protein